MTGCFPTKDPASSIEGNPFITRFKTGKVGM